MWSWGVCFEGVKSCGEEVGLAMKGAGVAGFIFEVIMSILYITANFLKGFYDRRSGGGASLIDAVFSPKGI